MTRAQKVFIACTVLAYALGIAGHLKSKGFTPGKAVAAMEGKP